MFPTLLILIQSVKSGFYGLSIRFPAVLVFAVAAVCG